MSFIKFKQNWDSCFTLVDREWITIDENTDESIIDKYRQMYQNMQWEYGQMETRYVVGCCGILFDPYCHRKSEIFWIKGDILLTLLLIQWGTMDEKFNQHAPLSKFVSSEIEEELEDRKYNSRDHIREHHTKMVHGFKMCISNSDCDQCKVRAHSLKYVDTEYLEQELVRRKFRELSTLTN